MTEMMPAPLTPADCDCTDLDGFMLNVERLMASELVALSTHEIVAAALFVWCRAWKQRPAASLPDDDRVIAAFSRLPIAKFRRHRQEIMRGFVKCSDGRLYHKTLAAEAVRAFAHKTAFHRKRIADNERLKKWRQNKQETHGETHSETTNETHFVAEGQDGTGQDGTVSKEVPIANAIGRDGAELDLSRAPAWWPKRDRYGRVTSEITEKLVFDVGKVVLGNNSGGQITKMRKAYRGDMRAVVDFLLQAQEKSAPAEWFAGVLKRADRDQHLEPKHAIYPMDTHHV